MLRTLSLNALKYKAMFRHIARLDCFLQGGQRLGGETSASEQKGVMHWPGTLLRFPLFFARLFSTSVRACDVVCPLDTTAVTKL